MPITSPGAIIDTPGDYYIAADLVVPSGVTGITITASDVTLDLQGHTITGKFDGTGIGIDVGVAGGSVTTDVVIEHGSVSAFGTGIRFRSVSDSRLNDLVSDSNTDAEHLGYAGGDGLLMVNSSSNSIDRSNFFSNDRFGVEMSHSDDNRFANNGASSNFHGGFWVGDSDGNDIMACVIAGSYDIGLLIGGDDNTVSNNDLSDVRVFGAGNTILNNTVGGGDFPIVLGNGSSGTTVLGNTVEYGAIGILVSGTDQVVQANRVTLNNVGIEVVGGTGHVIQANAVEDNIYVGIAIEAGATGNFVLSNTSRDNGMYDMEDLNSSCVNTWDHNNFVTDDELGHDFGPRAGCIQ
jgi:parallel beta-helix repeat protein